MVGARKHHLEIRAGVCAVTMSLTHYRSTRNGDKRKGMETDACYFQREGIIGLMTDGCRIIRTVILIAVTLCLIPIKYLFGLAGKLVHVFNTAKI